MAQINFVQSRSNKGSNVLAFSSNTTAGSLLFVFTGQWASANATAVSDTQGNTYLALPVNNTLCTAWVALSTVGGANTVTATSLTGSGQGPYMAIAEYSVPAAGICCYPVVFSKMLGELRYFSNASHITNETTLIFGIFYSHNNVSLSGIGGVSIRETVLDTAINTVTGLGDVNLASLPASTTQYAIYTSDHSSFSSDPGYTNGTVLAVSVLGSAVPGGLFALSGSKLIGSGIYVS